jgi:hypothetical protein
VTGLASINIAANCVLNCVTESPAMNLARSSYLANIHVLVSVVKHAPLCAGYAIRIRSLKCSLELRRNQMQGMGVYEGLKKP